MLRFNDGVDIDTNCELKIIQLQDGLYVVGNGMCIPISSYEEGLQFIKGKEKQDGR